MKVKTKGFVFYKILLFNIIGVKLMAHYLKLVVDNQLTVAKGQGDSGEAIAVVFKTGFHQISVYQI